MRAKVIDEKCCANKDCCTVLEVCPLQAISYIEVDSALIKKDISSDGDDSCIQACGCGQGDCEPSPYGRIYIDQDKCNACGICISLCCSNAIELVD